MWRVIKNSGPTSWSTRTIKSLVAIFIAIAFPVYIFIGFQPFEANSANYPTLEIPTISLNTPVEPLELQDNQLIAPARIAGSYAPQLNKTLLIGHSSTIFENLHSAEKGDQITYDGLTYKITNITTLPKSEINMTDLLTSETTPTIVLMTCAGDRLTETDYTHRLIITAELTSATS